MPSITQFVVVLQFGLTLDYKEEIMITYLEPGVEYCVTVAVKTLFNSNTVTSKPHCAFTSPPPPTTSRTSPLCYWNTNLSSLLLLILSLLQAALNKR